MINRIVFMLILMIINVDLAYGGGTAAASELDGWVGMIIAILGMFAFLKIMFGQKEEDTLNDHVQ